MLLHSDFERLAGVADIVLSGRVARDAVYDNGFPADISVFAVVS